MNLSFQPGQPTDTVSGALVTFTTTVPQTVGSRFGMSTVCADTQTISGSSSGAPGRCDRQTGHLTGLALTVTVQHSLAPGAMPGMWDF